MTATNLTLRRNNYGFTLVEAVIAVGVFAFSLIGIMGALEISGKTQHQMSTFASLLDFRTRMVNQILNDAAWAKTGLDTVNNPNLGCVAGATATCTAGTANLTLYDSSGNVTFNPADAASANITESGAPCPVATPSPLCPVAVALQVQVMCPAGPTCLQKDALFRITLSFNYSGSMPFNRENYDMVLYR